MAAKSKPSKSVKFEPVKSNSAKPKPPKAAVARPAADANAKVKTVKAARTASAQAKPATATMAYYVSHAPLKVTIHDGAPTKGTTAAEFSSFAAAKDRAVDQLIGLIEEAERRLHATRRAANYAEYRRTLGE